jgi:hypothetical protein
VQRVVDDEDEPAPPLRTPRLGRGPGEAGDGIGTWHFTARPAHSIGNPSGRCSTDLSHLERPTCRSGAIPLWWCDKYLRVAVACKSFNVLRFLADITSYRRASPTGRNREAACASRGAACAKRGSADADERVAERRQLTERLALRAAIGLATIRGRSRSSRAATLAATPVEDHGDLRLSGELAREIREQVGLLAIDDEEVLGHESSF